ncbi:MAG: hypothetical protein J07HQW1_01753 [Haloquadratum walsbyi J07HQW1]|uniref:Uncharacterized protein n=1 Tax=Haloquadratum walsbyi J07HQW1 TaxID=1238424 RepID=U1MP77_9EURY|nr:MAG: hypothetical protein J07HQW1_01753 [Haloquadratum walsbyi J07HQW1]
MMTDTEFSIPHSDTISLTDIHPNANLTNRKKPILSGQTSLMLNSVANIER